MCVLIRGDTLMMANRPNHRDQGEISNGQLEAAVADEDVAWLEDLPDSPDIESPDYEVFFGGGRFPRFGSAAWWRSHRPKGGRRYEREWLVEAAKDSRAQARGRGPVGRFAFGDRGNMALWPTLSKLSPIERNHAIRLFCEYVLSANTDGEFVFWLWLLPWGRKWIEETIEAQRMAVESRLSLLALILILRSLDLVAAGDEAAPNREDERVHDPPLPIDAGGGWSGLFIPLC